MGNDSSTMWSQNYHQLKQLHDDAYKNADQAISLEEQERPNDAVNKYKEAIALIDQALSVVIACPDNPDTTWNEAVQMVAKMKRTRAEILLRINSITSAPGYVNHEPPPSYEVATTTNDNALVTYKDLAEALAKLHVQYTQQPIHIMFTTDDVRFYCISGQGEVLSTSENQTLNVALIEGGEGRPSSAFLEIGNWLYPLIPGVSPCYRTKYRAFILPDVHSDVPGSCVGFIVPPAVDAEVLGLLEDLLYGVISEEAKYKRLTPRPCTFSHTLSNGIVNGAQYLSQGLVFGAQKTSDLLDYSTPKVINSLSPAHDQAVVPSNVIKGVEIAEKTTCKAASITGLVAEGIGNATSRLGQFLAPHIHKQGTRLLTKSFNLSEQEASEKVNGVLTVAAGAVEGFATVYKGLETSASILGRNLRDNSVKIVEHKYGKPAGEVASGSLKAFGNCLEIGYKAKTFTPKGLAKKSVKEAGKALARSGVETVSQPGTSSSHDFCDNDIDHLFPNVNSSGFNSTTALCKKD